MTVWVHLSLVKCLADLAGIAHDTVLLMQPNSLIVLIIALGRRHATRADDPKEYSLLTDSSIASLSVSPPSMRRFEDRHGLHLDFDYDELIDTASSLMPRPLPADSFRRAGNNYWHCDCLSIKWSKQNVQAE